MTGGMAATLIFVAAAGMAQAVSAAPTSLANRPGASARAIARIEIISGARFGPDHREIPPSARRRSARLIDGDGQIRPAELLEFQ